LSDRTGAWNGAAERGLEGGIVARSVLRHIRVASKQELKDRIVAGIDDVNRHPVIHTWSYKLAEAA
jgi:hypothetical protein